MPLQPADNGVVVAVHPGQVGDGVLDGLLHLSVGLRQAAGVLFIELSQLATDTAPSAPHR